MPTSINPCHLQYISPNNLLFLPLVTFSCYLRLFVGPQCVPLLCYIFHLDEFCWILNFCLQIANLTASFNCWICFISSCNYLRFSFNHDTWAYFTVHHPFTTSCNIFVPFIYNLYLNNSYSNPLLHYPKRTLFFLITFPIYCNMPFSPQVDRISLGLVLFLLLTLFIW